MWIFALERATAGCGGKAAHLARLLAAGLPVPAGFALAGAAVQALAGPLELGADMAASGHALAAAARRIESAEIPPDLAREVEASAAALGALAVRSSSTIEDGAAGAGAGVFGSRTGIPATEVWPAIRAVWSSALAPLAIAYARRRGAPRLDIGVIVQRFVAGERVTVYTRPPAGGDEVWVQRGEVTTRLARTTAEPIVELALAAEAAIGAGASGADVELVVGEQLWLVQARPIVRAAPGAAPRVPPPPIVLAALADGQRWTWDIAHNPDPLSPAQAGLVALVAADAPWAMRVCAGYLYTAPRAAAAPAPSDLAALEAAMLAALGPADDAPSLAAALARYRAFYARWAALSVALADARRATPASADARRARPSSVEAMLLAVARGELTAAAAIARLAPLAPAWDVAVPTFGERPHVLEAALARAVAPPAAPAAPDPLADLAERDDFAFARAQRLVRSALRTRAGELGVDADDIFWLPLDEVAAATSIDRDTAHRRAAAARAAAARAAAWEMPVHVGGPPVPAGPRLHGIGHGPRVIGRVARFASLASAELVARGDIVVTRAVTPALALLVGGCAAIVSETGGALDHGAALARELGVPCVVGCHGAWSDLTDGEIVCVDGDAGTVERA